MRLFSYARTYVLLIIAVMVIIAVRCTTLPSLDNRQASYAISPNETQTTTIGQTVSPMAQAHPNRSGIYALSHPHEAFAARALLASAAERTLDVQYYIWRNDLTGVLLLDSLRVAADRGVRVRLLLDDIANGQIDHILAALNAHPNIEVRLFNPLAIRFPRWVNYIVDFSRVNRRMHNKSFTVDNQATIIGGRNIGDEYFGATQGVLFSDLDVMAVGAVVQDVSHDFDRYWNSESAYPAHLILAAPTPDAYPEFIERARATTADSRARTYVTSLRDTNLIHELIQGELDLEWAPARMLSDDPKKALGTLKKDQTVAYDLARYFGNPQSHLDLVSAYFVPTKAGVRHLAGMASQGITIRILTNSLAATDVAAVHAGYAKWRTELLKAGIALYEMRPHDHNNGQDTGQNTTTTQHPPRSQPFSAKRSGSGGSSSGSGPGLLGSSGSSLHAKTLSIDDERIFVGSFNFDPRSAALNTELGFVIDSPRLSHNIHETFMGRVPTLTYKVHLTDDDTVYWTEYSGDTVIRYDSEPQSTLWRRMLVGFLSLLPIDWLL